MKTEVLHGYLVELAGIFDKVRSLEPDWDGEGGMVPDEKSISDADTFVRHVVDRLKDGVDELSMPEVNPVGCDGSIDVVWSGQNNFFLIVNFKGDGHGYFLFKNYWTLEEKYGYFIASDKSTWGIINECINHIK